MWYLILANRRGVADPVFYDIGIYFYDDVANRRNVHLDVVTEDEKGFTSYECKYTKEAVGKRVVEEEEKATILALFPETGSVKMWMGKDTD
ncbi:MAG: hypothetical protein MR445_02380 [Erysipelotrichaceae bacterium]|nr:hypothetical protein [Erysipelotrichaceae bacterium]